MGQNYLIDTNVIIYFLNRSLFHNAYAFLKNRIITNPVISFISPIETLAYPGIRPSEENKTTDFLKAFHILFVNEPIISEVINIRRKYKWRLGDSIIAANALTNDFALFTANTQDFKKVTGLKLLHPADL